MAGNAEAAPGPDADEVVLVLGRTHVVVVVFDPDLVRLRRQFSVLEGCDTVIVDNGSVERLKIRALVDEFSFDLIALTENTGIATAQNLGVDRVRSRGAGFVVFFDQDSIPADDALEQLAAAYVSVRSSRVAGVGSRYSRDGHAPLSGFVSCRWFRFTSPVCDGGSVDVHPVDLLISSGSFVPLTTIDAVGGWRESLFIDRVDTEWFLRAKRLGFQPYGSCAATMEHPVGDHAARIWAGRWRTVPRHPSERYFYVFRNTVWLYRQPNANRQWISADLVRMARLVISMLLIGPRGPNLRAAARGVRAGFGDF